MEYLGYQEVRYDIFIVFGSSIAHSSRDSIFIYRFLIKKEQHKDVHTKTEAWPENIQLLKNKYMNPSAPQKKKNFMPLRGRIYASLGINIFFAFLMTFADDSPFDALEVLWFISISFLVWLFIFWELNNMLRGRKAGER